MALTQVDNELLRKCLERDPQSWRMFLERYGGLVYRVVENVAASRSLTLNRADKEDLAAEVFVVLLSRDMAALRSFQGKSSLATYLSVIARRVVVRRLMLNAGQPPLASIAHDPHSNDAPVDERISSAQLVQKMLSGLVPAEAQVVRLFHLEGKTYREISRLVAIPENTIGPILSRARARLRDMAGD